MATRWAALLRRVYYRRRGRRGSLRSSPTSARAVANVAGKIHGATQAALKVAEAARSGNLDSLETALSGDALPRTQLNDEELAKMMQGLVDFAEEQIWGALNPPLRKVLGKALNLLDRVLDVPRNALVGAVGSVPFMGGVLASALNFGLGVVVGVIKDFLEEQVLELAHGILKDVMKEIGGAMQARLRGKGGAQDAQGAVALLQMVGEVAGEIRETLEATTKEAKGSLATLAMSALGDLVLRGIANPELRSVAQAALKTALSGVGAKGFNLGAAAGQVLKTLAGPAGDLVARNVRASARCGATRGGADGRRDGGPRGGDIRGQPVLGAAGACGADALVGERRPQGPPRRVDRYELQTDEPRG